MSAWTSLYMRGTDDALVVCGLPDEVLEEVERAVGDGRRFLPLTAPLWDADDEEGVTYTERSVYVDPNEVAVVCPVRGELRRTLALHRDTTA